MLCWCWCVVVVVVGIFGLVWLGCPVLCWRCLCYTGMVLLLALLLRCVGVVGVRCCVGSGVGVVFALCCLLCCWNWCFCVGAMLFCVVLVMLRCVDVVGALSRIPLLKKQRQRQQQ